MAAAMRRAVQHQGAQQSAAVAGVAVGFVHFTACSSE